jgi:transcriptional/translational regulatory protein YebC/TACO1
MNEDLKDTLNQTSNSWPAFYEKVEAIQKSIEQESQEEIGGGEERVYARKIIAIAAALKIYQSNLRQHTVNQRRSNAPNLNNALREQITAFCQLVFDQTGIDLTQKEGKEEFLTFIGLKKNKNNVLPDTKGVTIDRSQNENPPLLLPDGVALVSIKGVILPPDETERSETGSGAGRQEAWNQNRVSQVLDYLQKRTIDYNTKILQGNNPKAQGHLRPSSYVVITTLDPEAQIIVNDFYGEALYLIHPPQNDNFLTTTGKQALRDHQAGITPIPSLIYAKRVVFDQNWQDNLTRGFADIRTLNARESQGVLPSDENVRTEETPSVAPYKRKSAPLIIDAWIKNPDAITTAIRKAVKDAYGKVETVTLKDLAKNPLLTITLPPKDGQEEGKTITVSANSLYAVFKRNPNTPSLMVVLGNPEALRMHVNPIIKQSFKDNQQDTIQAIRKAVADAYGKLAEQVTHNDLRTNRLLTITLPPKDGQEERKTVTIGAASLHQAFQHDKDTPSLLVVLGNSKALVTYANSIIIQSFKDNQEDTIQAIRKAVADAYGKLAEQVTHNDLRTNRLLTITLPPKDEQEEGETFTIGAASLCDAFQNDKETPSLLAVLGNSNALANYEIPIIIQSFQDNQKETIEAIRKAVADAYGKLAEKVTLNDLTENRPLTITLPPQEGQEERKTVTIGAASLHQAFQRNKDTPSLLAVLGNSKALANYEIPIIIQSFQDNQKETIEAIRKAVADAYSKLAEDVTHNEIQENRPLTITLPPQEGQEERKTVTIGAASLHQAFQRNKGTPSLLAVLKTNLETNPEEALFWISNSNTR